MKTTNTVIVVIAVVIIIAIVMYIVKSSKKQSILTAAINSGIPPQIANDVANSSNPKRSFQSLGVPESVATLISLGTSVTSSGTGKEIYQCKWTDPKSGATTIKDGACTLADANQGWVTSSK